MSEQELISFRDLVLSLKNTFFYGRAAVAASVVMIWVKSLVTEREALKKAKGKKTSFPNPPTEKKFFCSGPSRDIKFLVLFNAIKTNADIIYN